MTDFNMEITGQRIKEMQAILGYSQSKLANKVGVAQNTIAQYEKGSAKTSVAILMRLAIALETTTDYLIGLTDDPYCER